MGMSNDGYEFEVLRIYDTLQRVVRNPDYERLCQDLIFDGDGFTQIDTILLSDDQETRRQEEALTTIRERYGVSQPIHPSVILESKYPPEFFSQIPILEKDPFFCRLVFHRATADSPSVQALFPGSEDNGAIISSPIHNGHYLTLDIDLLAPVKAIKSALKEYMDVYRECLPMGLQGGRDLTGCLKTVATEYIRVRIDLLGFEKTAMEIITQCHNPIKDRMRFDERTACYAVWDKRRRYETSYKEKLMSMDIRSRRDFIWKNVAASLGVDEDTARKRYARAYFLITGRKYGVDQWRDEKVKCLVEKAEKLSSRDQIKTWEAILRLEGMPEELSGDFAVRTDLDFLEGDPDPWES
jgi:hypothetical protein